MAPAGNKLLTDLLKQVSRSFYLTLRVLPGAIRPQISLAYLLARATDTIADTEIVPVQRRLDALQSLRDRILGGNSSTLAFGEFARSQGSPAERVLLERVEEALALLSLQSIADRLLIREVLQTITSGQELDLRRFAEGGLNRILALETPEELDDYTHRVAGCVGEFWTRMCRAHLFPRDALDDATLLRDGVRFGRGLQLVNILRDLAADLRQGRCYLPRAQLGEAGLKPEDLLRRENEPRLRPVYNQWLDRAEAHLAAGWRYTNALPWRCARVRLACAWPVLIGLDTLQRLRTAPVLDPDRRVKVGRADVRRVMFRTVALYGWPSRWRRLGPAGG